MSNQNVKIEEIRFVNNTATTKIINPERKELTIKAYTGDDAVVMSKNQEIEQSNINPNISNNDPINIEITLPKEYDLTHSLFLQVTGDGVSSNQSINLSQSGAPLPADEIEKDYGLSQFPEKHMFGAEGALGKNPMKDGILNPDELQELNPEEKIKSSYNQTKTNTTNYADQSEMVTRTESGLVVPKTDKDVDHNVAVYKTDKITEIQTQLDFCNNIQSLYIDKHEELKTVFALTLNLFQFYSYSLNVIEKLIKAYDAKKEKNILSIQREHIIYLTENTKTDSYELPIDYYSSFPDNYSIDLNVEVKNLEIDPTLNFISCLQENPNQNSSVNFKEGQNQLIFKLANMSSGTANQQYKIFNDNRTNPNDPVSIKYLSRGNLMLHIQIVTPNVTNIPILQQSQPFTLSPSIISTSQSESGTSLGGVVHFKKFSNIDKLKDHQEALKEQLQKLHQFIIESPNMEKPLSSVLPSGGELPIQGGAKKKKKTESININEAINDLIGGTPFNILNYYQNEIVEKNGIKYFVDFNDNASFSGDAIKNVLNLINNSTNEITFTELENDGNKFKKSSNIFTYSEKDNSFQNKNNGGDLINKFTKLKHSRMIELLEAVIPANLNKPIVFDSEFYKSEVYRSLFDNSVDFK